jgi:hypothetical protein
VPVYQKQVSGWEASLPEKKKKKKKKISGQALDEQAMFEEVGVVFKLGMSLAHSSLV